MATLRRELTLSMPGAETSPLAPHVVVKFTAWLQENNHPHRALCQEDSEARVRVVIQLLWDSLVLCKAPPSSLLEEHTALALWEDNAKLLEPVVYSTAATIHCWRSFVSFLNQQIDKNRLKSSNAGTSITTLTSDERKPMQQVPRPATMAIAPIVATTKARQPMITTTSSPPQKLKAIARKMYNAGQDVTISPSMAVGSTPGSSARPQSVNRAREAPIKPLLYAQQQESLPPQPYQQLAKVYPPPNRPGATAIPTVWPLPSSSDSMAWSVSRSYSSSTHFSSAPTKPNKAKRTLPPQLKQIDRRKNTNSSPSAAWPFGPAALRLQPARRHLQAVHMAGGLAAMGVERLSSPGMERDGKEMETIAHTLLSLASASPEYSSAITGHGPEGRGKKKCGTGVTSAPSQEQQCIQI